MVKNLVICCLAIAVMHSSHGLDELRHSSFIDSSIIERQRILLHEDLNVDSCDEALSKLKLQGILAVIECCWGIISEKSTYYLQQLDAEFSLILRDPSILDELYGAKNINADVRSESLSFLSKICEQASQILSESGIIYCCMHTCNSKKLKNIQGIVNNLLDLCKPYMESMQAYSDQRRDLDSLIKICEKLSTIEDDLELSDNLNKNGDELFQFEAQ